MSTSVAIRNVDVPLMRANQLVEEFSVPCKDCGDQLRFLSVIGTVPHRFASIRICQKITKDDTISMGRHTVSCFHLAGSREDQAKVDSQGRNKCRHRQMLVEILNAAYAPAFTFAAKSALGSPTNRAWPITPLTAAAAVIGP